MQSVIGRLPVTVLRFGCADHRGAPWSPTASSGCPLIPAHYGSGLAEGPRRRAVRLPPIGARTTVTPRSTEILGHRATLGYVAGMGT
jgi:hypothetical protein